MPSDRPVKKLSKAPAGGYLQCERHDLFDGVLFCLARGAVRIAGAGSFSRRQMIDSMSGDTPPAAREK
jgi:hypothetical protein